MDNTMKPTNPIPADPTKWPDRSAEFVIGAATGAGVCTAARANP